MVLGGAAQLLVPVTQHSLRYAGPGAAGSAPRASSSQGPPGSSQGPTAGMLLIKIDPLQVRSRRLSLSLGLQGPAPELPSPVPAPQDASPPPCPFWIPQNLHTEGRACFSCSSNGLFQRGSCRFPNHANTPLCIHAPPQPPRSASSR